jgi:hypothetical protein
MSVDVDSVLRFSPLPALVVEVTNQLLFLGIYTYRGLSRLLMHLALLPNVLELLVAFGMRLAFMFLDIQPQPIPRRFQQPTDDRATHPMPKRYQSRSHIVQPTIQPFGLPHRVAGRVWLYDFQQAWH